MYKVCAEIERICSDRMRLELIDDGGVVYYAEFVFVVLCEFLAVCESFFLSYSWRIISILEQIEAYIDLTSFSNVV